MRDNSNKSDRAQREEEILKFWQGKGIFNKSLEKDSPKGDFVFYEGPPTANGRPGIHHLEARAFKDAIPRYKTMRGYHVARRAGWDTHGLPVELEVEKELGLKSKKEIEEYGVDKFNEKCKESVWKYVDLWRDFTDRIGYWVDIDNAYVTYKNSYMETVWSVISHVNERNLLYKDYKVVPWCPRCGTALSSHELAQGYKDVKDLSVTVEFRLVGEDNLSLLAWTTTPWTLPGNIALAVGENIDYVEIEKKDEGEGELVRFILAKDKLKDTFGEDEYKVLREMKGSELVGMEYESLYPFTKEHYNGEGLDKAYKVYPASFVNTEDGTGIVHTSVMYGQDDFELGTEHGLPKYHLVDETGHFTEDAGFLAGKFVKDEEVAVDIIKDLAHRGLLFKKEKYEHSYPFCWRCKTPLIYYARDSWYIRMSDLRKELVEQNKNINWEPDHIKEGRFGEWLREVKDWALTRERYWGTPLPVWVQTGNEQETRDKKQEILVVDSVETLKKYTKTRGNKFIGMRHAEGEHNVASVCSSDPEYPHHLTDKGKEGAKRAGEALRKEGITKIIISPYVRTRETADIVAEVIGYPKEDIVVDERLSEYKYGNFHLKPREEMLKWREGEGNNVDAKPEGGESIREAKQRFSEFVYEMNERYEGETILFISHGIAFELMPHIVEGLTAEESWDSWQEEVMKYGEWSTYDFVPLPHNSEYELDLHKPYIDDVMLEKDGEEYRRVKEVMDVWFDSGTMPFAQDPENVQYPADFISEAIDQTRGWFYTLHAIGVLMERGNAYKNVICLGHILDKEGKKMSKSVGNVVNPWEMMDKYGVDTLRLWMYSVNQPGESKNFDERSVDEIQKRVFNLLDNVYSFLSLYTEADSFALNPLYGGSDATQESASAPRCVLDRWILARLDELVELSTSKLDAYKLLEPVRAMREFIDDLSTWYLRRSRDRIKGGDKEAIATLRYVLKEVAKLLAPFAPFYAEDLYQKLRTESDPESVHLEKWPTVSGKHSVLRDLKHRVLGGGEQENVVESMVEVRRLVSLALEQRQKADIKLRQPLKELRIKNDKLGREYLEVIKEELNVKSVVADASIGSDVELDTEITPELAEEGEMRELVRKIQDLRKEKGLQPGDKMQYDVPDEEKLLFEKFGDEIRKTTDIEMTNEE